MQPRAWKIKGMPGHPKEASAPDDYSPHHSNLSTGSGI